MCLGHLVTGGGCNRGSSREIEEKSTEEVLLKDRSTNKSIMLQFLKDIENLVQSACGQKLGLASAGRSSTFLSHAEGYKRGETSWLEKVMESWRANLYQLLFYVFIPLFTNWLESSVEPASLSSEGFGTTTSRLHEKRRNCNISHHHSSFKRTHTDMFPAAHRHLIIQGVNNDFAKGRTVIPHWYLKLCHWIEMTPLLLLVKRKCLLVFRSFLHIAVLFSKIS